MKLKLDANGNVVTKEVNGVKMPVYVHDDGTESEFDAKATVAAIAARNAEAKSHREAKEAAEAKLATFTGIDPVAAKDALDKLSKIDAKKLVDAGQIDQVKADISRGFQAQIDELTNGKTALEERIYSMTIGGAFAGSEYVKRKLALPVDFIQARFAENFGLEGDKLYAVDANGNKIYSKARPSELATFDEAMEVLVGQHPQRDSLLKGTGASGTGAPQGGGGGGPQGRPAGNLGGTRTERQQALAARFPELAQPGS